MFSCFLELTHPSVLLPTSYELPLHSPFLPVVVCHSAIVFHSAIVCRTYSVQRNMMWHTPNALPHCNCNQPRNSSFLPQSTQRLASSTLPSFPPLTCGSTWTWNNCVRYGGVSGIFQFWDTTALFSPVKVHKKCINLQYNRKNWPKFRVHCTKRTPTWKNKYTTAGGGGGD